MWHVMVVWNWEDYLLKLKPTSWVIWTESHVLFLCGYRSWRWWHFLAASSMPAVKISLLLPRLPSQTQMIPLKLNKGHYMYQYIGTCSGWNQTIRCIKMLRSTVTGSAMLRRMMLSCGRHCQQSTAHYHNPVSHEGTSISSLLFAIVRLGDM